MNLDYLKHLDASMSETFNRGHVTYESLESKAKYIATAFAGLLVGIAGYGVEKIDVSTVWQQAFLIALMPPFFGCFWFLYQALKSQSYDDGMKLVGEIPDLSLEDYYKARIDYLQTAIAINANSNTIKSSGITGAIVLFISSFFLAILFSACVYFANRLACEWVPTRAGFNVASFLGSAAASFFLVRHILSQKNLIEPDDNSESSQEST